jgi:hypothetical protein
MMPNESGKFPTFRKKMKMETEFCKEMELFCGNGNKNETTFGGADMETEFPFLANTEFPF